ncbi:TonB-dependent receptor [Mucilaginibacter terrae]|uniref:Outer membrane receptor for ferrienterochelin and colicins n=1 Tax=Mucilaginibacter terrae TaxID=1955052 RepID=A0ABU3GVS4_9SPHI|nr:TonB-dependent receptor [Mucilaginibacter terrae]MDT3403875.1 outer membrane receptor for ferrienterochelin and colicins [Mucilaginibacter terrae]
MKLVFTLFFLFITGTAIVFAQSKGRVAGKVLTSDGKPADAICILVDGRQAALTQYNGSYNLSVPEGNHQLAFSFMNNVQQQQSITVTAGKTLTLPNITLKETAFQLNDVIVTGQFEPQSVKNSVYQVRTINNERIRLRGASNIQQVLNTELGVRFANDLTLGTTDINLMGVSGQRVKILLDGTPLLDRGDTRESLGQIDVNMIEKIEIVEGPMSVMYGTDALGGVINLITKKAATGNNSLLVGVRVQEESAGKQYDTFNKSGTHNASLNLKWQNKGWNAGADVSRNNFGGWKPGNGLQPWLPKNQWLANATAGYANQKFKVWYRINATDEDIISDGAINASTNVSKDQKFITHRYMHELQGNTRLSDALSFNFAASYTDYSRRTQTTEFNHATGTRFLTATASEQAVAKFDNTFIRGIAQYKISEHVNLQPGFEVNLTGSTGDRILGTPTINDYSFFASSEIALGKFSLRPGFRVIHNSVYDAPPVIPSFNAKVALSPTLDLRVAYAYGYRSPALRELYFNFFDASHSIIGNPNLKAEYSNSYNGTLSWQLLNQQTIKLRSVVGGFYNQFHNFIGTAFDASNGSITTYLNIDRYKTVGGTMENTLTYKNLQATLGFYYTGRYNQLKNEDPTIPQLSWSPEVNSNIAYTITQWKTSVALFYKYTGKRPSYEYINNAGTTTIQRASVSAFNTADFSVNKIINRTLTLNGGIRNVFNVTRVNNTSQDSGGAHSTGGAVPVGYGRSFFLGFNYQFSK